MHLKDSASKKYAFIKNIGIEEVIQEIQIYRNSPLVKNASLKKRGGNAAKSSDKSMAAEKDGLEDFHHKSEEDRSSVCNLNVNQQKRKSGRFKYKSSHQKKRLVSPLEKEDHGKPISNFQHTKSDGKEALSLLSTDPFSWESDVENCPSEDSAKSSTSCSLTSECINQHTADLAPGCIDNMISELNDRAPTPLLSFETNQLGSGENPRIFVMPLDADDIKALALLTKHDTVSNSAVMSSVKIKKCNVITPPSEYMHITSSGSLVCALRVKKRILELLQRNNIEIYLNIDILKPDPSDIPQKECFIVVLDESMLKLIPSNLPFRKKRKLLNPRCKLISSSETLSAEQHTAEIGSVETSFQPANSDSLEANTCPSLVTHGHVTMPVSISVNFNSTSTNQNRVEDEFPKITAGLLECAGELSNSYTAEDDVGRNGDSTLPNDYRCQLGHPAASVTHNDATVSSTNIFDLPLVHWKSQDIQQWFIMNDLGVFLKDFASLDGPCLVELVYCFIYNSEFLNSYLKDMGYTLIQVLRLASKLRILSKLVDPDC